MYKNFYYHYSSSQFNNISFKFSLLTGISGDTLTYTTYTADFIMSVSDLGGAAEDASEFSLELKLNGKATEYVSA